MIQFSDIERDLDGLVLSSDFDCDRKIRREIEDCVNNLDRDTLLSLNLHNARHVGQFPIGKLRQIQSKVHEIFQQHIVAVYGNDWKDNARIEEALADLYLGFIQKLMRSRLNTLQIEELVAQLGN